MFTQIRTAFTLVAMVACVVAVGGCGSNNGSATGNDNSTAAPLTTDTASGPVTGISTSSMREFLGIPYAAPPVGALRWKAPQPVTPWKTALDASHFSPSCIQQSSSLKTSENCLYLNVYTPTQAGTYPVMVWIYGGALVSGNSDQYDPERFVKQGVVVVTFNYRLGALGFLATPALSAEQGGASGDYGLMDQQAALEWVKNNIANFDGDPDNVTLFGESAGGLSVLSQLVSPKSKTDKLFNRAIVESGSYTYGVNHEQPLSQAEQFGTSFTKTVGCTSSVASQVTECLRSISAQDVLKNQGNAVVGYVPDTGTPTLPQSITAALTSGNFYDVPVIEGTNKDESGIAVAAYFDLQGHPVTPATYLTDMESLMSITPQTAQTYANEYPLANYGNNAGLALATLSTDFDFSCAALAQVNLLSKAAKVYGYEFNDPNAPTPFPQSAVSFPMGSMHGAEIPYLFINPAAPVTFTAAQTSLSNSMVAYWTQFAKTGDPNGSGTSTQPDWSAYTPSSHVYINLAPPTPSQLTDFATEHHCSFWDNVYNQ